MKAASSALGVGAHGNEGRSSTGWLWNLVPLRDIPRGQWSVAAALLSAYRTEIVWIKGHMQG